MMSDTKQKERLQSLLDAITADRGRPMDAWEITALLEIYGLRDIDAQTEYGYPSLFELAKDIEPLIDTKEYEEKHYGIMEVKEPNKFKRISINYFKGLAFSIPMLLQILMTLVVGYAIWSSLRYDVHIATLIAIGTFLALVITGATSQAIGRKGLYYLKLDEFALAAKITTRIYVIGLATVLVLALILLFFQIFFHMMLTEDFIITLAYYLLLSILFLGISVYYMFEEYAKASLYFAAAMIMVYIFYSVFQKNILMSQIYALIIIDIIVTLQTFIKLKKLKKKSATAEGEVLPRSSVLAYTLLPFYLYGIFYFLLLLVDRIIAWSVYYQGKPYFIWFIVPYEVGLDWALIALVILIGLTEVSIYEYMYRSQLLTYKYKCSEYKKFNEDVFGFFRRFNLIYFLISIGVVLFVYLFIYLIDYFFHSSTTEIFFHSPTPFVYWIGAISYVLIVNTLMNILLLFSLSRFMVPVRYALFGVLTDIIVGLILSRLISYEYAVFGLLAGSAVFFFGVMKYTRNVTKKFDFYYYSAF